MRKRLRSLKKQVSKLTLLCLKRVRTLVKTLPKEAPSHLKRLWTLVKTLPKSVLKCLNLLWSLTKKISRLIYTCMKGTAMFLVCCILMIALIRSFEFLPAPRWSSIQIERNLPDLEPSTTYNHKRSIVRLYHEDDFFCSGVVIGNNYLLTAAHCLTDMHGRMQDEEIVVVNDDGSVTAIAKAAGVNTRMDWGLVQGNFSRIPGAKVAEVGFHAPAEVLACGYPQGAWAMTCQTLIPRMNDGFYVKCHVGGLLFPGMSGGPVFDKNGVVIGLNVFVYTANEGGGVAYSPTTGILANFKIADY